MVCQYSLPVFPCTCTLYTGMQYKYGLRDLWFQRINLCGSSLSMDQGQYSWFHKLRVPFSWNPRCLIPYLWVQFKPFLYFNLELANRISGETSSLRPKNVHFKNLGTLCLLVQPREVSRGLILGRGFVPVPSSFAVKSSGLGVSEQKIHSLGFGVRKLRNL